MCQVLSAKCIASFHDKHTEPQVGKQCSKGSKARGKGPFWWVYLDYFNKKNLEMNYSKSVYIYVFYGLFWPNVVFLMNYT